MYRPQIFLVPIIVQPLPPPFINPYTMQQPLVANPMPAPFYHDAHWQAGPVYQRRGQHQQFQNRASSSGPLRNHRLRFAQAEPQHLYHIKHVSSGAVVKDRSTGIHPGYARMGARNNTRAGKRTKPYDREPITRDYVSTSVYKIPMGFKRDVMAGDPAPSPSTSAQPTSTPRVSESAATACAETTGNTCAQESKSAEDDDDLDTISLGSED